MPSVLAEDGSIAAEERTKADRFYAKSRLNAFKNYPFKVYKNKAVKSALEALFSKKCAYCESKYARTQPMDVEHWRPKGGVVIDGEFWWPGYWWLAAAWGNLLPSCIDCNRKRRYFFPEDEVDDSRGKENLFPVKGRHADEVGGEVNETPLLLDPCSDDPAFYLNFGDAGMVAVRAGLRGAKRLRANHSIQTYGLDRPELVEARAGMQSRVLEQMAAAGEAYKKFYATPGSKKRRRSLGAELRDLRAMGADSGEYAGTARQLSRPLFDKVGDGIWLHLRLKLGGPKRTVLERFVTQFAPPVSMESEQAEARNIVASLP